MIQYILECIAFQLVFLLIYDLFLKKETFFQWNRVYLLGTYVLSLLLPWIKIEALKTKAPEVFQGYPEFMWNANDAAIIVAGTQKTDFSISWEYMVLFGGMFLATVFFGYKLFQLYALKQKGEVQYFKDFTRVIIKNSSIAFSFFKSIFLGDKVIEKEHQNILEHELVHIRERHSYDLFFFEIMRIVGWFNPLVYVYQSRIAELHEFIADAKVAKTSKKEQYEFLLSQVFQTQNISFINQFFKSSLIKKRIVMLQKTKSSQIWRLKYLMVLPLVFTLLVYTSCDMNADHLTNGSLEVESVIDMTVQEEKAVFEELKELELTGSYWEFTVKDELSSIKYAKADNGSFIQFDGEKERINGTMVINSNAPLSKRINELREIIDAKDSLSQLEKGQLAQLIYEVYPEEVEGISREKGTIVLTKNKTKIKYNDLVAERSRLLLSMDEKNPIIVNLDAQIAALKSSLSQDGKTVPFATVEVVPVFPGCENENDKRECFRNALDKHIGDNIRYPKEAQEKGIHGRVSVMFTITTEGNLANVRMRGRDKLLEDEAARIISLVPQLMPGIHKGKKVNVPFSIPITFVLGKNVENVTSVTENANQDIDVPFAVVEEVPVFPGCESKENLRECFQKSMQKHISKNFRYPEEAQEKGIQGRVSIMFTISKDGTIQKVRMRGPDKLLEEEAARIISLLPVMIPGKQDGKKVDVPYSIPITFKLEGPSALHAKTNGNAIQVNEKGFKIKGENGLEPIYIVDGVETDNGVNQINPNNIESINVLKGESAKAVYGERGANGAVLINLKKEKIQIKEIVSKNGLDPIFIVEGKETTKENFEKIKPDDLKSMNVLKDESAIKKYGSKATNGVIEIELKKKD